MACKGKPEVHCIFDKDRTCTATFVVLDPDTKRAAVIDSVLDFDITSGKCSYASADAVVQKVEALGAQVEWILETHVHADHLTASRYLQARLGGKIAIGDHIKEVIATWNGLLDDTVSPDGTAFDVLLADGQEFRVGNCEARVLWTPGHTPSCCTYVIGDAAFCGDTIFMPDMGSARCDFPGGSSFALFSSAQKILELPDEQRLFVGHDYAPGGREHAWETTVGAQKASNKHLKTGTTLEEFVAFRTTRDAQLNTPKNLYPAIQVNVRAGSVPAPAQNGAVYFKVPMSGIEGVCNADTAAR